MKVLLRPSLSPVLIVACFLLFTACSDTRQVTTERDEVGALEAFTDGMRRVDGFLSFYLDEGRGRVYLSLQPEAPQMIYQTSLPQGVGSNDLGFDRGQLARNGTSLVRFEPVGDRVLLRRLNTAFRANSGSEAERRSVEEAFASSVLWGFPVVARDDGRLLLDATDFLLRDSHGIARALRDRRQGDFKHDASRSGLYYERIRSFPRNTEFEATITFTGDNPGDFLADVAPDPYSFSVRMHHSFVALPEPGYRPRQFLPESGFYPFSFRDYAVAIEEPVVQRYISRHRLEKKIPGEGSSEPVEPIIYYLDPGTPEPVRSALLDGARWWNDAFAAAGYENAFRVEMLPDDADPMDVRYNVIQWVHRATRGWSYGSSITDPRTGEIIKGHVTLGSLRVRQDYLIAQGMTSPFSDGDEDADELSALALDRIRQLSAHEVGHTLGLAHNFAASARGRASVMDYPHPRIVLDADGEVALDDAYDKGIGDWDKINIRYGYADFPAADSELVALSGLLKEARAKGYEFISDPDSRASRQAHPRSHLWDNGADAVAELERLIDLREYALDRFGHRSIANGRPFSDLEEILVPVYFHHRYQAEAVGKWIGGLDYRYALREGGEAYTYRPVSAVRQRRALLALMRTLRPEFLALDESLRQSIPPKAYGYERTRESAGGYTGRQLDPVSLAEASVQHTLDILLEPERLARLALQHADDSAHIGVGLLFAQLQENLLPTVTEDGYLALLQQRTAAALLTSWRKLVQAPDVAPEVRAESFAALESAARFMRRQHQAPAGYAAFYAYQLSLIEEFRRSPDLLPPLQPRELPPGSPIGG
ncbi:MAG: zinc-dependent metalloprotease [Chromatocurvus sp.]